MLLVLPAATSYITRDYIIKFYYSLTNRLIPYPTFMLPAFQGYRPYSLSLSYPLLSCYKTRRYFINDNNYYLIISQLSLCILLICYRPYELSLSYFFTLVVDVQIFLDM